MSHRSHLVVAFIVPFVAVLGVRATAFRYVEPLGGIVAARDCVDHANLKHGVAMWRWQLSDLADELRACVPPRAHSMLALPREAVGELGALGDVAAGDCTDPPCVAVLMVDGDLDVSDQEVVALPLDVLRAADDARWRALVVAVGDEPRSPANLTHRLGHLADDLRVSVLAVIPPSRRPALSGSADLTLDEGSSGPTPAARP